MKEQKEVLSVQKYFRTESGVLGGGIIPHTDSFKIQISKLCLLHVQMATVNSTKGVLH